MGKIILSIVTVVYNDIQIEKTIQSIIPFLSEEVEYIVIDGASNDGTIEVINKYKSKISVFINEPDKGIYDAMNKAAKVSSGKFILHLNVGDYLINLPLNDLKDAPFDICALTYPCLLDGLKTYKSNFDWKLRFMNRMHHQSTFYRRDIIHYELQYKIFADHDLNLRLYKAKCKVQVKDEPCISYHSCNGISSQVNNKYKKERRTFILKRSGILILLFSYIYRLCNKIFQ